MAAVAAAIEFAGLAGAVRENERLACLPGVETMMVARPEACDHRQAHGRGNMHGAGIRADEDARGRCQGGKLGERKGPGEIDHAITATLGERVGKGLLPGLATTDDDHGKAPVLAVVEEVPA